MQILPDNDMRLLPTLVETLHSFPPWAGTCASMPAQESREGWAARVRGESGLTESPAYLVVDDWGRIAREEVAGMSDQVAYRGRSIGSTTSLEIRHGTLVRVRDRSARLTQISP